MNKLDLKTVIPVAVASAGIYILYKLFLEKSETEKSQEKAQTDIDAYIQTATTNQQTTKSRGEWAIIAETIYNDLRFSAIDDNKPDAIYQLCRVKNDADIATLIDIFGRRQEYFFAIPTGDEMDLASFVRSNLDNDQVAVINDNYRRKNIKFRF